MALLRVTPEELEEGGQSLIQTASEMEQLLQKLDGQVQLVQQGWEGMAQGGYAEMYAKMKQTLQQVPGFVDDLGKKTMSVANAFRDVDTNLAQKLSV